MDNIIINSFNMENNSKIKSLLLFRVHCALVLLCFLCHSTQGAHIVWKNHVKISSDLHSDLERIPYKLLSSLNLLVDEDKFERLHNLARSQPEVGSEYQNFDLKEYDYQIDYGIHDQKKNETKKRLAEEKQDYVATTNAFVNGSVTEYDYNMDQFKKEYDSVTLLEQDVPSPPNPANISEAKADDDRPFQINEKMEEESKCMKLPNWEYLYHGVPCIWYEIKYIGTKQKLFNIILILFKTTLVWSLVATTVAAVMWCYKGMCCCCLKFDILHPYDAMKRIKNEAIFNPPGVEKLPDGSTITYKPTRREIKAYETLLDSIYS